MLPWVAFKTKTDAFTLSNLYFLLFLGELKGAKKDQVKPWLE